LIGGIKMDKRIGAQLYTLRDFCKTAEDLDSTLEKVSAIGYKILQVSGIGPIPAKEIREIADKHNLEIKVTHRGFPEFTKDIDALVEFHKTLGADFAGIGMMPSEYYQSKEDLMRFVKLLCDVSVELSKNDLGLSYHNHALEFAKFDGEYIFDTLLNNTPESCKFMVDVHWVAAGGVDPAKWLLHCKDRLSGVHFKDFKILPGTNNSRFAEVLEGST
jgi:sugar phosphate isomerase/epimerase